ncbi:PREDICTED: zinc finger BED domain-containing protein 1-like [Rhagoletis zephyria]|uniref:zinc finger BED domain-containing protein 1-like n=2 Tax=Rhagoletis TaxID=28609 RepID=UPI0008118E53|nr:PREDICTED: zinc finger BED domain-containing protein 1-like [Rhagoletis zephyria]
MSKKKSDVWLHFSAEKEVKVKCLLCAQVLSVGNKSTFSLLRHLSTKHPTQTIRRQDPAAIVSDNNNNCVSTEETAEAAMPASCVQPRPSIAQYFSKPISAKKKHEIDHQLVTMIVREYHPFSVVEDAEFKKLVFMLNPSYKLPTRKTISSTLVPATYSETVEIVKQRLGRAYAVCLTVDGWTSRAQDSFISVTAHYIVEDNKCSFLASDLLSCVSYTERHTSDNITKKLTEILQEWDLGHKITVIATDNAANMKASLNATAKGMELPVCKLINDVPTRWNSTYEMLKRILLIKDAVISTVAVVKSSALVRDEGLCSIDLLSNEEWLVAQQTMDVMEMFEIVTTTISGEKYVSASTVILYVKQLDKHLRTLNTNELTPFAQKLVKKLLNELSFRFRDLEQNELIAQATILDPRFKKFGFISELSYNTVVKRLYSKVGNTTIQNKENEGDLSAGIEDRAQNSSSESHREGLLWKDFDAEVHMYTRPQDQLASAIVELDKYLAEPILPRKNAQGKNNDPLFWWSQRKHIYLSKAISHNEIAVMHFSHFSTM